MGSEPISLNSEVVRIRARARGSTKAESAHRYAERCRLQVSHDEERRALATLRLNAIVSRLAELAREMGQLELEVLDIADVLVT